MPRSKSSSSSTSTTSSDSSSSSSSTSEDEREKKKRLQQRKKKKKKTTKKLQKSPRRSPSASPPPVKKTPDKAPSVEKEKKKPTKKKKQTRSKTPVSPSVSHPRNKQSADKQLEQDKNSTNHKRSSSADSALAENVLPLLLENVVNHTEKVKFSVDKDDTVEAFFKTLYDARGEYSINNEPEIISIPTPIPPDQVISSKKKDRSSTHQPVVKPRAKEKKRLPDADDDSDNDTGMYTEPQSKVGQETKLLRKRIQPHSQSPELSDGDDAKRYAPLNSGDLKKKFEDLVNIGAQTKEVNSKARDNEFKKWRKDNGEDPSLVPPTDPVKDEGKRQPMANMKHPKDSRGLLYDKRRGDLITDSGFNTASQNSSREYQIQKNETSGLYTRPVKVSKSTSGAQTEEHPAMMSASFTIPDVLMLDSYTQTNEEDRLSTRLITCRRKVTTDAQTDPVNVDREIKAKPKPLVKKVSFSDQPAPEPPQNKALDVNPGKSNLNSLRAPIITSQESAVNFELNRTCRHGNDRGLCSDCNASVVQRKYKSPLIDKTEESYVSYEIPPTCRHGNERATCSDCNASVVKRKYKSPLIDKSGTPVPVDKLDKVRVGRRPPLPPGPKDEERDSGQESDSQQHHSPRLSDAKLNKIKHLARAKLKQIKAPEDRVTRSLERPRFKPDYDDSHERSIVSDQGRRRKRRTHDGVESWTLSDLPSLADQQHRQFVATPMDTVDEDADQYHSDGYYGSRSPRKLRDEKRLADVTRAKNFIKHCIDKPIDEGGKAYKHTSRRDSGVSSLPVIGDKHRRCESQPSKHKARGIADDVESRNCVSEVPTGKMRTLDVNYKAYIHALERIVDSNLSTLAQAEKYYQKK